MGRDEGTAGNAADLVKHTVWLSVLDELMKVSPWKERIVVHETHAGRGLYAPVSQANREHARWLCVSAPSTVILASAQERVRQHLGLGDCVAYAGSALLGMASICQSQRSEIELWEKNKHTRGALCVNTCALGSRLPSHVQVRIPEKPARSFDGLAGVKEKVSGWGPEHVVLIDPFDPVKDAGEITTIISIAGRRGVSVVAFIWGGRTARLKHLGLAARVKPLVVDAKLGSRSSFQLWLAGFTKQTGVTVKHRVSTELAMLMGAMPMNMRKKWSILDVGGRSVLSATTLPKRGKSKMPTTWVYRANATKANQRETRALASGGFIWRSGYQRRKDRRPDLIGNVQSVVPGDRIILLFSGVLQGSFRVLEAADRAVDRFPALAYAPEAITHLSNIGYHPDPILQRHTGFLVEPDGVMPTEILSGKRPQVLEKLSGFTQGADPTERQMCNSSFSKWSFATSQPSGLSLPRKGAWWFLGIDVGYSRHAETLGFCVLKLERGGSLDVDYYGTSTLDSFLATSHQSPRGAKNSLARILREYRFDMIALDGPIAPAGYPPDGPFYRPMERLLSHGEIPKRISAQPYKSPVGRDLTDATAQISERCKRDGYSYASMTTLSRDSSNVIVEAFPKLWLATTFTADSLDDQLNNGAQGRSQADWSMAESLLTPEDPGDVPPTYPVPWGTGR